MNTTVHQQTWKGLLGLLSLVLLLQQVACTGTKKQTETTKVDEELTFQILQINDVYEIAPLEGGKVGGMARVAQVKKELLAENPNTIAVMAGDFLNPSVMGVLKYQGERIKGKQMIEAMNAAGIDLATFGNHEFDLKEAELLKRVEESDFAWTIANVFHQKEKETKNTVFQHRGKDIPPYHIETFTDSDGTTLKVAFISVCLNSNQPDYVVYDDPFEAFEANYLAAQKEADVVIGLTHQNIEEDMQLAKQHPELPLIMGGHEHHNMLHTIGKVIITKADANAKSAYVHKISHNKTTGQTQVNSSLKKIDETVAKEEATDLVVQKWMKITQDVLQESGINPNEVVMKLKEPLDARESLIRHKTSPIAELIAKAMRVTYPDEAQGAILNTGSIRMDDLLTGQVTQYDIVRLLPYGGGVQLVELKGNLILDILKAGKTQNVSKGGFLVASNLTYDTANHTGTIGDAAIEADTYYKVTFPDYLMLGLEQNLGFLKPDHPDIKSVYVPKKEEELRNDVRLAVVDYMQKNGVE
ncbi:MAG: bifunctional metallophosphatase/5'-nucleotidase [Chitinophagales bacterium]